MTMVLSGDGTITGLVAGGLPNATVTSDDLAAGAALNSVSDGVFFRNRIINGDMRIDQRNAGAAVSIPSGDSSGNVYTVDRWIGRNNTDGVFTVQQDSSVPAGFNTSSKITVTTADASIGAAQWAIFNQRIEGFNVADLGWGTANAKTVTLSFWVRSSLTGTFAGYFTNADGSRKYVFTYPISVADTWEYKTVTLAGDTSGTWQKTSATGIDAVFSLAAGSDANGTAGVWTSSDHRSVSGAVQVLSTLNATWYVTGVQLEVGSVATPFERRPYGTELSLCQRYYSKNTPTETAPVDGATVNLQTGTAFYSATNSQLFVYFPVVMRASPTMTFFRSQLGSTAGRWAILYSSVWNDALSTASGNPTSVGTYISVGSSVSLTVNGAYLVDGIWTASAEL